MEKIIATNETIYVIVRSEIERLGNRADLNHIDVSRVTRMRDIFLKCEFDGNISKWDTINVIDTSRMFQDSLFDGDISKWNVSNVIDMDYMFTNSLFDGDISNWVVNNVTSMRGLFSGSQFNDNISNWDVSKVTDMRRMFANSKFNGDISKWCVSNVIDTVEMFDNCPMIEDYKPKFNIIKECDSVENIISIDNSIKEENVVDKIIATNENIRGVVRTEIERLGLNADLNHIDVSNVTNMRYIFSNLNFKGDISNWDLSNVTDTSFMFLNCPIRKEYRPKFIKQEENVVDKIIATNETIRDIVRSEVNRIGIDADLNHIDVSKVTNMEGTFANTLFNGDISKWDLSNVTGTISMFSNSLFNGDISNWNVSNVTNMKRMFSNSKFNGDISNWNVSNVIDMIAMFEDSLFDGDISNWDLSNVTDTSFMFLNCPIRKEYKPKFNKQEENVVDTTDMNNILKFVMEKYNLTMNRPITDSPEISVSDDNRKSILLQKHEQIPVTINVDAGISNIIKYILDNYWLDITPIASCEGTIGKRDAYILLHVRDLDSFDEMVRDVFNNNQDIIRINYYKESFSRTMRIGWKTKYTKSIDEHCKSLNKMRVTK